MSDPNRERPCIHIGLAAGADAALARALVRALEVGAEEEGVPCRLMATNAHGAVAVAHEAAFSSRFGIGLGLDRDEIVLHEMHMPAEQPVLRFGLGARAVAACRAMGANAARLLVHRPLHIGPLPETVADAATAVVGSSARPSIVAPQPVAPGAPAGDIASAAPAQGRAGGETNIEPAALARVVAAVVERLRERGIR